MAEVIRDQPVDGSVVFVHEDGDVFVDALAERIEARGHSTRKIRACEVASVSFRWEERRVQIDGEQVSGLVFRASPDADFGLEFEEADVDFVNAEVKAIWLGLMQLPLPVLNRLDAEVWYSMSEWPVWRRRFVDCGIPVAPLVVGSGGRGERTWLPWGGGKLPEPDAVSARALSCATTGAGEIEQVVFCEGEVLGHRSGHALSRAARAAKSWGITLMGVAVNVRDEIVMATSFPGLDETLIPAVSDRVAGRFDEALISRR